MIQIDSVCVMGKPLEIAFAGLMSGSHWVEITNKADDRSITLPGAIRWPA